MTTSGSDFDAAKAVAEQLKGLEKERQQRILRWVAESLSLELGIATATEWQKAETTASRGAMSAHEEAQLSQRRPADIKTFVDSKNPRSDNQFAPITIASKPLRKTERSPLMQRHCRRRQGSRVVGDYRSHSKHLTTRRHWVISTVPREGSLASIASARISWL